MISGEGAVRKWNGRRSGACVWIWIWFLVWFWRAHLWEHLGLVEAVEVPHGDADDGNAALQRPRPDGFPVDHERAVAELALEADDRLHAALVDEPVDVGGGPGARADHASRGVELGLRRRGEGRGVNLVVHDGVPVEGPLPLARRGRLAAARGPALLDARRLGLLVALLGARGFGLERLVVLLGGGRGGDRERARGSRRGGGAGSTRETRDGRGREGGCEALARHVVAERVRGCVFSLKRRLTNVSSPGRIATEPA